MKGRRGGGGYSLLEVSLPSITKALGSVSSSTEEVEEMKGMLYRTKANCPWMVIDGTPGTREEHKHAVFSLNKVLIRPSEAVFQPWAHLMPSKTLVTKNQNWR